METKDKIVIWAQVGAALGKHCGKMCSECVFKSGTIPNNDEVTVIDATDSMWIPERPFHCAHRGVPEGQEPVCSGYRYAMLYLQSPQFFKDVKRNYDTLKIPKDHNKKDAGRALIAY